LKRAARSWKTPAKGNTYPSALSTQAYTLYVLALAREPETGAMNRLRETEELKGVSRWLLASAWALAGHEEAARQLMETGAGETVSYDAYDYTYGSTLRDQGILLNTLCLLGKDDEAADLARRISEKLCSPEWLSTQETAQALMGISSFMERHGKGEELTFSHARNGKQPEEVRTKKNVWSETLTTPVMTSEVLDIKNEGASTLFVRVIAEGTPAAGEEKAYANGLTLDVRYPDDSGRDVTIQRLARGTDFQAVLTIRNPTAYPLRNLAIMQIFPAGWEILNTRFLGEAAGKGSEDEAISFQDIRDDRVCSYIDHLPPGRQVTVRINLTAAYAGEFYLPPAYCEAMYDPLIRANTEGRTVFVE
jgi:uncharacterized protein YfaS (alpha-2-macroglobulin family)